MLHPGWGLPAVPQLEHRVEGPCVAHKRISYYLACLVGLVYKDNVKKKSRYKSSICLPCLSNAAANNIVSMWQARFTRPFNLVTLLL